MSILVSLISEFQDRGFKNASKQAGALEKGFKKLAVALGSALSVRKITQFSKAAVKAFAEDNKAASALAKTLENLGLGFQSVGVEQFISSAQKAVAVSDDYLRPAMADLLRATQSVGEAQTLLNLALDVSAGTGKDLRTVTNALSRAYLGNTTSLSRLNAGLTKAFLTSASFEEIQAKLSDLFSGDAQRAANTYAGKLQKLEIAADEARETIGEGLVTSIEILGGAKGIDVATQKMEGFAKFTSDLSISLAGIAAQSNANTGGFFSKFGEFIGDITLFNQLKSDVALLAEIERTKLLGFPSVTRFSKQQIETALKDLKVQKSKTQELKAQNKAKTEASKLDKAKSLLDLEKIQIEAALQGDLTENEKLRLQLMKAIVNENADRATTLAEKLTKSQTELASLKAASYDFKPANPFDAWLEAIEAMRKGLASIGAPVAAIPGAATPSGGLSGLSVMPNMPETSVFGGAAFITPELATQNPTGMAVNIKVEGSVYVDDFERRVVDAVVAASSGGGATNWYRTTGRATL